MLGSVGLEEPVGGGRIPVELDLQVVEPELGFEQSQIVVGDEGIRLGEVPEVGRACGTEG